MLLLAIRRLPFGLLSMHRSAGIQCTNLTRPLVGGILSGILVGIVGSAIFVVFTRSRSQSQPQIHPASFFNIPKTDHSNISLSSSLITQAFLDPCSRLLNHSGEMSTTQRGLALSRYESSVGASSGSNPRILSTVVSIEPIAESSAGRGPLATRRAVLPPRISGSPGDWRSLTDYRSEPGIASVIVHRDMTMSPDPLAYEPRDVEILATVMRKAVA